MMSTQNKTSVDDHSKTDDKVIGSANSGAAGADGGSAKAEGNGAAKAASDSQKPKKFR